MTRLNRSAQSNVSCNYRSDVGLLLQILRNSQQCGGLDVRCHNRDSAELQSTAKFKALSQSCDVTVAPMMSSKEITCKSHRVAVASFRSRAQQRFL